MHLQTCTEFNSINSIQHHLVNVNLKICALISKALIAKDKKWCPPPYPFLLIRLHDLLPEFTADVMKVPLSPTTKVVGFYLFIYWRALWLSLLSQSLYYSLHVRLQHSQYESIQGFNRNRYCPVKVYRCVLRLFPL